MKQQIIWFRPSARDLAFVREGQCRLAKGDVMTATGGPPQSEVVAWEAGSEGLTRYWFLFTRDFIDGIIDGWNYSDRDYPATLVDPHSIRAGEPSAEPRLTSVSRVIRKAAKSRLTQFRAARGERIRKWWQLWK